MTYVEYFQHYLKARDNWDIVFLRVSIMNHDHACDSKRHVLKDFSP